MKAISQNEKCCVGGKFLNMNVRHIQRVGSSRKNQRYQAFLHLQFKQKSFLQTGYFHRPIQSQISLKLHIQGKTFS